MKLTEEQKQVTEDADHSDSQGYCTEEATDWFTSLPEQNRAEFKVWDELFGILAWKFTPTKSGDMMIDAERVYNELKDKFELKPKPIET
jgi:hypothetical protein